MLSHEGFEELVTFDIQAMSIIGEISHQDGLESFASHSASFVDDAFKRTIERIRKRQELKRDLIEQVVSLPELVQSGEAKATIEMGHSEGKVGMIIKMMLTEANGARFAVQELSCTAHTASEHNKINNEMR